MAAERRKARREIIRLLRERGPDDDDLEQQSVAVPLAEPKRQPQRLFDFPRAARTLSRDEYTVGWICALPAERAAAEAMLDDIHQDLRLPEGDNNSYNLGNIGEHNIVIACLPSGVYGTTSAAYVASDMRASFKSLRFGLMVGIAGGVPGGVSDIRRGDVVVSHPTGSYGGVIQFDFGKTVAGGHFQHHGPLNKPPSILLAAVAKVRGQHMVSSSRLPDFLTAMIHRYPKTADKFTHRGLENDNVFQSTYKHPQENLACERCDTSKWVTREPRPSDQPAIHYGLVASGNQVMKDGVVRDRLAEEHGVMCFEMEAAGLVDNSPCLAIHGICDYADSHKNKLWQEYAAAIAATYAKELLLAVNATEVKQSVPTPEPAVLELQNRRRQILESLRFDQIDARYRTIAYPHRRTCEWLLEHPQTLDWLNPKCFRRHHGLIWIKGKSGAGKSTLMKFAYNSAKETMQDALVISFFFNASGEDLERSTAGMYRALITQLLDETPYLHSILDDVKPPKPIGRE